MLNDVLNYLDKEINYIFEHQDAFLNEFANEFYIEIVSVAFTGKTIKVTYAYPSGSRVIEDVSISDYIDWKYNR